MIERYAKTLPAKQARSLEQLQAEAAALHHVSFANACFVKTYLPSRELVWASQGIGIVLEEAPGGKTFWCELQTTINGEASQTYIVVKRKTRASAMSKTLKKIQTVAKQLAVLRAAGWHFKVFCGDSKNMDFRKRLCAVNPLTGDRIVLATGSRIELTKTSGYALRRLTNNVNAVECDLAVQAWQMLDKGNKPGKNKQNFGAIVEQAQCQLAVQASGHDADLVVARLQHVDGETFNAALPLLEAHTTTDSSLYETMQKSLGDLTQQQINDKAQEQRRQETQRRSKAIRAMAAKYANQSANTTNPWYAE